MQRPDERALAAHGGHAEAHDVVHDLARSGRRAGVTGHGPEAGTQYRRPGEPPCDGSGAAHRNALIMALGVVEPSCRVTTGIQQVPARRPIRPVIQHVLRVGCIMS
jgi:hypothetical protein